MHQDYSVYHKLASLYRIKLLANYLNWKSALHCY